MPPWPAGVSGPHPAAPVGRLGGKVWIMVDNAEVSEDDPGTRFPEVNSAIAWFRRLSSEWTGFTTSTLTHADLQVLHKLNLLGLVEKQTTATFSVPSHPVTLWVVFESSGFDTLPEFITRDIRPLVPEWGTVGELAFRPEDAFHARLTTGGEVEAANLRELERLAKVDGHVDTDTDGIDLLTALRGSLSLIADYAERRYARVHDYRRVANAETVTPAQGIGQTNRIPSEFLTRVISKAHAAQLHSGQKKANGSDYIATMVARGKLSAPIGSGRSW